MLRQQILAQLDEREWACVPVRACVCAHKCVLMSAQVRTCMHVHAHVHLLLRACAWARAYASIGQAHAHMSVPSKIGACGCDHETLA